MGGKGALALEDEAPESLMRGLFRRFKVAVLSAMLISCAIGTRAGFKVAGYSIGTRPYIMIMLTVIGSIPLNAIGFAFMTAKTGGVMPQFRTRRYFFDYWVVASLNVVNGLGIMWANPFVSGYLQSLLSSMAIPMTVALSAIFLGSRFSLASIVGVALICLGVLTSGSKSSGSSDSPLIWVVIYAASQIPLAAVSVYQEFAFVGRSLNMFHYIHYVTLFLLADLAPCAPLDLTAVGDSTSYSNLWDNTCDVVRCLTGSGPPACDGAGWAFGIYIVCMNAGTVLQAVLIKNASASWCMVVLSLATPLTALSFLCPWIVGEAHVEKLDSSVYGALVLVGCGTFVYRVGSIAKKPARGEDAPAGATSGYYRLEAEAASPRTPGPVKGVSVQTDISIPPNTHKAKQLLDAFLRAGISRNEPPVVVSAGIGLFPSEYTNALNNPAPIWAEKTYLEGDATAPTITPYLTP